MGTEDIKKAFLQFPPEQRTERLCTLMTEQVAEDLGIEPDEALEETVRDMIESAISSAKELIKTE